MGAKPLRAIVWAAVSSKPQLKGRDPEEEKDDAGDSLAEQVRDGQAVCARFAWEVVATLEVPGQTRDYTFYQDAAAEMEAYREFQALCERKAGDVLVCRGRDRLGRSDALIAQVEALARQGGIQIYSMSNPMPILEEGQATSVGALYASAFERARAEAELIELKRRHTMGMRARIRRGLVAARAPYGWKRTGNDTPSVQIPKEIATLREMYRLYMRGWGYRRICGYLNAGPGRWPPRAKTWLLTTIPVVLHNPHNAGFVRWRDVVAVGLHEPAFTPEEWAALQAERRRRKGTRGKAAYPYSGIARCRMCGHAMVVQSVKKDNSDGVYIYYRCQEGRNRQVEARGKGHSTRVRVERIREAVLEKADRLQDPEELERACRDQDIDERGALQQAKDAMEVAQEEVDAEVRRMLDAYVKWGHVSAEVFDDMMECAAVRQRHNQEALAAIMARQDELPDPEERVRQLVEYASDVERWLDSDDIEEANAWLEKRVRAVWCEGREVVKVELI